MTCELKYSYSIPYRWIVYEISVQYMNPWLGKTDTISLLFLFDIFLTNLLHKYWSQMSLESFYFQQTEIIGGFQSIFQKWLKFYLLVFWYDSTTDHPFSLDENIRLRQIYLLDSVFLGNIRNSGSHFYIQRTLEWNASFNLEGLKIIAIDLESWLVSQNLSLTYSWKYLVAFFFSHNTEWTMSTGLHVHAEVNGLGVSSYLPFSCPFYSVYQNIVTVSFNACNVLS